MKNILVEKNIPCELSEGTVLRSDVYRPNDKGKYPVLMLRLPYDKETPRYYDEIFECSTHGEGRLCCHFTRCTWPLCI